MEVHHYAVRITRSNQECTNVWSRFSNVVERMVVYEHKDGARVHVHLLLESCKVSTDTLKNYIKKEIGVVNSRDWSFKTAFKVPIVVESQYDMGFSEYIKYMSKGKYEPVYNKGYSEEFIKVCKELWEDKVEKLVIKEKKAARQTEYDIQMMIEDELWPGPRVPDECPKVSKEDILRATRCVLEREKKFAHYQRVARLCQAVRWRFHPTECESIIFKMF